MANINSNTPWSTGENARLATRQPRAAGKRGQRFLQAWVCRQLPGSCLSSAPGVGTATRSLSSAGGFGRALEFKDTTPRGCISATGRRRKTCAVTYSLSISPPSLNSSSPSTEKYRSPLTSFGIGHNVRHRRANCCHHLHISIHRQPPSREELVATSCRRFVVGGGRARGQRGADWLPGRCRQAGALARFFQRKPHALGRSRPPQIETSRTKPGCMRNDGDGKMEQRQRK